MELSDQLKEAIRESGFSVYQISQRAGVTQSALSRFLSDDPESHRDIRLEATVNKLATFLQLELSPKGNAKKALRQHPGKSK
jgi:predicted transcriptional regulator